MTHGQPDASSTVLTAADIYCALRNSSLHDENSNYPSQARIQELPLGGRPLLPLPFFSFPSPPFPSLSFPSPPIP